MCRWTLPAWHWKSLTETTTPLAWPMRSLAQSQSRIGSLVRRARAATRSRGVAGGSYGQSEPARTGELRERLPRWNLHGECQLEALRISGGCGVEQVRPAGLQTTQEPHLKRWHTKIKARISLMLFR